MVSPDYIRPIRDLLRRTSLLVRHRTGIIQSLQNMAMRQTGQSIGWRSIHKLSDEERVEFLGTDDCLLFVTTQQVDLIDQLGKTIKQFETKVLEHAQLKPAYAFLLTMKTCDGRSCKGVGLALQSLIGRPSHLSIL